jgi:excinuclease ABC subunit C
MNLETFNKHFFKKLPDAPGVYFFLDEKGEILYIGKATSLRDRVKSYFTQDILLTRGPKIVRMLELAESIKWQMTDSALEALLFEANLIHKHRPPYNTDAKDDKSWNFVVITKEKFPRVLIERGRKIKNEKLKMKNEGKREDRIRSYDIRAMFGPFPSGGALKEAVKIIRRIFPFRDTCTSLENKKTSERKPCFNHQIGLCPGVCVGAVSAREYGKTIRNITLFFEGKKTVLVRNLEREMKREAKMLRFERAGEIKKTLFALAHIQDVALLKRDMFESPSLGGFGGPKDVPKGELKIEAYDVAHLGGTDTVGVMTVIIGREKQTSEYRKFIIRGETKGNDLSALEELLRRRLKHTEWELPNLIVVDGGDLQHSVAEAVLKDFSLNIPVVSVVKDAHHQPKGILGPKKERETFKTDILLGNSEAHRYAISFHRARRGKAFLKL